MVKHEDSDDVAFDWEGELVDFYDNYSPSGYVVTYSATVWGLLFKVDFGFMNTIISLLKQS